MTTCLFRVRPNTLLSLWYCVGCTLLQCWLLYLGFERYRLYTEIQWPQHEYPRLWLTVYIALLGACIPTLALFLAFGALRSGNLAGDSDQLGARPMRTIELIKGGSGQTAVRLRNSSAYRLCHCVRSAWTHAPPLAQSLHILLALAQLFAQQTMLAQLYRFGFINSGDFLNSELDFVFQRARQLATNLPMGETRLQSFRLSSDELAASPVSPNLLPILMHTRLFGIPLEFVNLLVALAAFSACYPAVFWRASKPFAICFSLFLALHSFNIVWTYMGFALLFRIQETNFYASRPVGMGSHLWALRSLPLFHPLALVISFWATIALVQCAPIALYSFGYGKFAASQAALRHSRRGGKAQREDVACEGYAPHVLAIALLLAIAAMKAPAFYVLGLLYQKEERPFLAWCLCADLIYLFVWIALWLLCTLKCQWRFRAHYATHELISLQDAHKTAEGEQLDTRTPSELKNALLLVHGSDLFITDDPIAKPAIMRQVLRSCAPPDQVPAWMRSGAPMSNSVPISQSPQRRRPMLAANDFVQRTPELGYQRQQQQEATSVPLAAPPYQRMASLPPTVSTAQQQMQALMQMQHSGNNTFGTLQRAQQQRAPALRSNDYAPFVRQSELPQYFQMGNGSGGGGGGTLSRNYSLGATPQQPQQQQQQTANPPLHYQSMMMAPPESYATIHRRCSKSSVGSGFAGPPLPSPQAVRSTRSASLVTRGVATQNGANNSGGIYGHYGQMGGGAENCGEMRRQLNGTNNHQQQQHKPLLNGFDGQRATMPSENGISSADSGQKTPVLMTPVLMMATKTTQQPQQRLPNSTFGGGTVAGGTAVAVAGWHLAEEERNSNASANGGGTTTPSGSVTLGGSRVSSAASTATNASASHHLNGFEATAMAPLNGFDCGTLTRGDGDQTLRRAAEWTSARNGKMSVPRVKPEGDQFATSVV